MAPLIAALSRPAWWAALRAWTCQPVTEVSPGRELVVL